MVLSLCDEEGDKEMPAVNVIENNKKMSAALLNIRHIAQQQMKKYEQTYEDVLKVVKEYKNGR